jgi:CSLREA domain-containing protein
MTTRLLIVLALVARAALADVTVNTTADNDVDDGSCSLREAIKAANTNASYNGCARSAATVDAISFNVGTGTPKITVTDSDLPGFSEPATINGATGGATRVEIAGGGSRSTGLAIAGTGSAVRNLVINGFTSRQLFMANGNGIVVEGNLLGTNAAGTAFVTGGGVGIEICTGFACGVSDSHQIGGPTAAQRNVIVPNGVGISVGSSSATTIQGNFIGTDITGTIALSPGFSTGIGINNAVGIVIGGADPGEGNVITGFQGVVIGGNPALLRSTGVIVQGNFIGTDVTGTLDLGGSGDGIVVAHAEDTQIGGLTAGAGNLVSGFVQGITGGSSGVSGSQVDDTTVQGNRVGTNAAGTGALPNSGIGIYLGDDAIIENNIVAFNGGAGVHTICGACVQRITANSIHSNGGLGISLHEDGVTPNDTDDPDTGANGRQNFPILDSALFPGGTSITGTLNSTPSTTFRVEIFANDACDASGNGEGAEFVGFKDDVTTDAGGDAAFTVTLSENVSAGKVMTATAIAPNGSTSELSPCTPAPPTTTTTSTSTTTSSTSTTAAPTTTTSSTSSSSTTAAPTTTSTSSSSSTSSSTAPVATTSTSTSTNPVPTTTTVPTTCAGIPDGPTFVSIDCRLEALLARVQGEAALDGFGPKLARSVDKARARNAEGEDLCRGSNAKKTKKRLQQAATALRQYAHRLNGLAARKRLDTGLRQGFIDEGAPIEQDLKTLRGAVRCS